jgi:hypothetical protein
VVAKLSGEEPVVIVALAAKEGGLWFEKWVEVGVGI